MCLISVAADIPIVFITSVWEVSFGIILAVLPGIVQGSRKPSANEKSDVAGGEGFAEGEGAGQESEAKP